MTKNFFINSLLIFIIFICLSNIFNSILPYENFNSNSTDCSKIVSMSICRASGCEIGKNNICMYPTIKPAFQMDLSDNYDNISRLKNIIRNQKIQSLISTGHLKKYDFTDVNNVFSNTNPVQNNTGHNIKNNSVKVQSTNNISSGQQIQMNREFQRKRDKSFRR
jgi:hypothetical protein